MAGVLVKEQKALTGTATQKRQLPGDVGKGWREASPSPGTTKIPKDTDVKEESQDTFCFQKEATLSNTAFFPPFILLLM